MGFGLTLPKCRLDVESKERMKQDECVKSEKQEALDGVGVMGEHMAGFPAIDQFVEAVIFDIPALMSETGGTRCTRLCLRQRAGPHPIADERFVLAIELALYRICFQGTNDPDRNMDLQPLDQAGQVPPLALTRSKCSLDRRHELELTGHILIKEPPLILEYDQHMLVAIQQKVEQVSPQNALSSSCANTERGRSCRNGWSALSSRDNSGGSWHGLRGRPQSPMKCRDCRAMPCCG